MAAGDTFRAAASDQLEVWAERTDSEIVVGDGEKVKAASGNLFYRKLVLFLSSFSIYLNVCCYMCHLQNLYVLSSFAGREARKRRRI